MWNKCHTSFEFIFHKKISKKRLKNEGLCMWVWAHLYMFSYRWKLIFVFSIFEMLNRFLDKIEGMSKMLWKCFYMRVKHLLEHTKSSRNHNFPLEHFLIKYYLAIYWIQFKIFCSIYVWTFIGDWFQLKNLNWENFSCSLLLYAFHVMLSIFSKRAYYK